MQALYRLFTLALLMLSFAPNLLTAQEVCNPDVEPPTASCADTLVFSITPATQGILLESFQVVTDATDNCTDANLLQIAISLENTPGAPPVTTEMFLTPGFYTVFAFVTDEAGNTFSCVNEVIVLDGTTGGGGGCDPDQQAPVAICDSDIIITNTDPSTTIDISDINEGSFDNCTATDDLIFGLTTDFNQVDPPTTTSLDLADGTYTVVLWVTDEEGNSNQCFTYVYINTVDIIKTTVYVDADGDCEQDPDEVGIPNWPIQITSLDPIFGNTITYYTDDMGMIEIPLFPFDSIGINGDTVKVEALALGGITTGCQNSYCLIPPLDQLTELGFGIQLADDCNALAADISTFRLRPCFGSSYTVNYCNYSSFTVEDAEVIVDLDYGIILESATVPYTDLGGNSYSFAVGDLASLECGQIKLNVFVDCDLPVGITQCATAKIEPYTCDDPGDSYNGPSLEITGECDETNDQVNFRITNVGQGDMAEPEEYNVIEDIIMYMQGQSIQLNSQEFLDLPPLPANGATWRVSVPQPEGHPGLSAPTLFIEGCGGLTSDMVNQFALNDEDPNVSIYCEITSAAYDPNDKQAYPRGYGNENFIEANTSIEYLIRFQNTGTDTAFNIVIEDQLDPALDFNTVRGGASSFPYRLEQAEEGLLRFHFDNIMLPDSNISEINSHGFVQFRVNQKIDNPIGTIIENDAAIFFDFNAPIITNTVKHTVGEEFIVTATVEPILPGVDLLVSPNPFRNQANLTLEGWDAEQAQFVLYDSQGRAIRQELFTNNTLQLERRSLASGIYFYTLRENGRLLARGKLIIQ